MACPHCGRDVCRKLNGAPFLHTSSAGAPRCDGSGFFDAQAPIPFRRGLDPKRLKSGPPAPGTCPKCGCTPDGPRCVVRLYDGGEAACLPAGTLGAKTCSACVSLLVGLLVAVLALACGGAPFTLSDPAPADVDAGEVLDGLATPAADVAGDGASHLEASAAADVDAGLATLDAGGDRVDAAELLDVDAGDGASHVEASAADAPASCDPTSCPACPALYVRCCSSAGACGCSSQFSLCH
jgi:hypothetical protein